MAAEKKSAPLKEDAILLLNKGKRGLQEIVFGRAMVIMLLLLLQIFVLVLGFFRLLGDFLPLYIAASSGLAIIMAFVVVNNPRQNPTVKLTWVVLILSAPIFAIPLYFFVDLEPGHRLLHRQLSAIKKETRPLLRQDGEALARLPSDSAGLASYMLRIGGFPAYRNTRADYYPLGDEAFPEMLKALEAAEDFIFLEYFIIDEGYMWGRILKILEEKARAGVEVRVMYDGTCAVAKLPYGYPRQLEALGIRCRMFAPLRVAVSTHYNNRDHRKIMVVDGKVAFTGGINLSDEYINRLELYGHWKDNAIRIEGEAVQSFTLLFLQMWNAGERKLENCRPYLRSHTAEDSGVYIPYGSCPYDEDRLAEMVYIDIINRAKRYIHIMTPYLVIDNEMATALTFAARRGVEVCLLLPHIPDKKAMFALAKTYYPQLLAAGVKLYEYTPGFVHAKMLVSDDCRGVVGTINFDYRSLYLHFECGLYMEDTRALRQMERDVKDTLALSREITLADWKKRPLHGRLTGQILRLFAPLL